MPYLSMDVWYEMVDNNETFFLRPQDFEGDQQEEDYWLSWLDTVPWPVTLIMNNNLAWSFPHAKIPISERTLNHSRLQRMYVQNPNILHPKLKPLAIGPKWQWRSTELYGESKMEIKAMLQNVSSSPAMTKALFASPDRTATVWVRPATQRRRFQYDRTNAALRTPRNALSLIHI